MGAYEDALNDAADAARLRVAELAGQRLQSLKGGVNAFYGYVDPETCRFGVGIVDEYEYLVYQDRGFATFPMVSLRGKVVPMIINGQLIFRKANGINRFSSRKPGTTTYWRRGADGELVPSVERRRAWVHPGLPPKNFLADGVKEIAAERADDIFHALMEDWGL